MECMSTYIFNLGKTLGILLCSTIDINLRIYSERRFSRNTELDFLFIITLLQLLGPTYSCNFEILKKKKLISYDNILENVINLPNIILLCKLN